MSAVANPPAERPVTPPPRLGATEKPTPEKMAQNCQRPSDDPQQPYYGGPSEQEPIIPWAKEAWLKVHQAPLQPALQATIDLVQFVSHYTFLDQLKTSIDSVKKWLGDEHKDGKKCVVLVEAGKSNLWVAELAKTLFSFSAERYMDLGLNNAESFERMLHENHDNMDVVREKFRGRTIVLFDDASYSGKQMSHHLENTRSLVARFHLEVTQVIAIVPFMTPFARALVDTKCAPARGLPPAHLSDAGNLRMLSDVPAPHYQVIINLWFKGDRLESDRLGLAYFQHKVPNDQSFPAPIAKGSVYMMSGTKSVAIKAGPFKLVDDPIPPYKGASPDRDYKPKPPKQPRCLFPEDEMRALGFDDKDGKSSSSVIKGGST